MRNNIGDYYTRESLEIIELKNIIVYAAIIVLFATIYFNNNKMKDKMGANPSLNSKQSHDLNVGISISSVIIISASIYICFKEYFLDKKFGYNLTGNELRIIAFGISLISTLILLHVVVTNYDSDESFGTEPIV
jgi:hypothetical protein